MSCTQVNGRLEVHTDLQARAHAQSLSSINLYPDPGKEEEGLDSKYPEEYLCCNKNLGSSNGLKTLENFGVFK